MKLLRCFFLFGLASSSILSWHRPTFVRLGLAKSRIPQFMNDLEHPYIQDTRDELEALDDPKETLCNLASSSRGSITSIPDDLFKKIKISSSGSDQSKTGWAYVGPVLWEVLNCPAALKNVEELEFDIHLREGPFSSPHILELFFQLFEKAPQVSSLIWNGEPYEKDMFEKPSFSALDKYLTLHKVQFPSVENMALGRDMEFLVPFAPKLRSLRETASKPWWSRYPGAYPKSSNDSTSQFRFVKSASKAKNLREFELEGVWSEVMTAELLKGAPNLEKIEMKGTLVGAHESTFKAGTRLNDTLETLSHFKNLAELQLPSMFELDVGLQGGLRCGNMYFGLSGTHDGRIESLRTVSLLENAIDIIMEKLPNLKNVCIGERCANLVTGERPTWPWTGRLRDYILEKWPRLDGHAYYGDTEKEDPSDPVLPDWEQDKYWFRDDKVVPEDPFQAAMERDRLWFNEGRWLDEDDDHIIDEL